MTRDEAEARSAQLNAEHPDRATHRWFAREEGGDWTVVRVGVGPLAAATGTGQPSKPESTEGTPGRLPGGVQPWAAGG
jgi:hypothetical protein